MEQTKIREQVIDDLKQYPELKKKVILLRYEQEHPAKISDSEVIDSMALSRPVSDGIRPAGFISDKTMRIATQFRDKKDRLNQETIMEIAQELYTVEQQISKLEFYVSQLEEKQAEVIRKYYFEGKTWGELQREMHLAPRTLLKRRDDGLDALVSIYIKIDFNALIEPGWENIAVLGSLLTDGKIIFLQVYVGSVIQKKLTSSCNAVIDQQGPQLGICLGLRPI